MSLTTADHQKMCSTIEDTPAISPLLLSLRFVTQPVAATTSCASHDRKVFVGLESSRQ
jgi:hypothetical protein